MSKLYFKYGAMDCSKSAQALMCQFNYEQKGMKVLLMKPSVDNRNDTESVRKVKSRIGLEAECLVFDFNDSILEIYNKNKWANVIIVDEAHFCTTEQINQFKEIANSIPVLCYGLKTNFKVELFEGSKRLIEIADSLQEIKSVCKCGRKCTVNARIINGKIVTDGEEIVIGGNESYESMCYNCFVTRIKNESKTN